MAREGRELKGVKKRGEVWDREERSEERGVRKGTGC